MEQLALQVEPSDSSYMPSLVAVLAGSTVGGLRELKQCSIPAATREFVLLTGVTEVRCLPGYESHERDSKTQIPQKKHQTSDITCNSTCTYMYAFLMRESCYMYFACGAFASLRKYCGVFSVLNVIIGH